jgi:hypothetical protein
MQNLFEIGDVVIVTGTATGLGDFVAVITGISKLFTGIYYSVAYKHTRIIQTEYYPNYGFIEEKFIEYNGKIY